MGSGFCRFDNTKWKLGDVFAFNISLDGSLQDSISRTEREERIYHQQTQGLQPRKFFGFECVPLIRECLTGGEQKQSDEPLFKRNAF